VEFRRDFWHQKTRVPGLSHGVVCVILRLAGLVQYRLVADGRTDRQTTTAYTALAWRHAVKNKHQRAMHTSRGIWVTVTKWCHKYQLPSIQTAIQNSENGAVGVVRGQSRSLEIEPFD